MRYTKLCTLVLYIYPLVYGIILLFLVNQVFGNILYSLFNLRHITNITSRFINTIYILIINIDYIIILLILVFIESIRLSIINVKILSIIEFILIFIYTWSIEVIILYIIVSYILNKLIEVYLSNRHILSINMCLEDAKVTLYRYETRVRYSGVQFIVSGICIYMHIIYSYFIHINIVTILLYLILVMVLNSRKYKKYIDINETIEIILSVIPPFGILIPLTKSYITKLKQLK